MRKILVIVGLVFLVGCTRAPEEICLRSLSVRGIGQEQVNVLINRASNAGLELSVCDAKRYFDITGLETLEVARADYFEVVVRDLAPDKDKIFRCMQIMIAFTKATNEYEARKQEFIRGGMQGGSVFYSMPLALGAVYDERYGYQLEQERVRLINEWGQCN